MRIALILRIIIVIAVVGNTFTPGYAYHMAPDVLCEMGIKYYQNGQFDLALANFNKALLANPDHQVALQYIALITQEPLVSFPERPASPQSLQSQQIPAQRKLKVSQTLDQIEGLEQQPTETPAVFVPGTGPVVSEIPVIDLEEGLKNRTAPIEIEKDTVLIVRGKHILRFLATQPEKLQVQQRNLNEIQVSGLDFGSSYLHMWDDNGRWTLQFLVTPLKYKGQTFGEAMRKLEEQARNFKLRYSVDWSSFESGRRMDELNRQYYVYTHNLALTGDTPYGAFDSSLIVETQKGETHVTSGTVGLENGVWSQFKGFSVRAFDFAPLKQNLAFPGETLRGAQFYSPAFYEKMDYSVFWGEEISTGFLGVTPGSTHTLDSYVSGTNINFYPAQRQRYSLSAYKAGGQERSPDLKASGYDASLESGLGPWDTYAEVAYDSDKFAHILGTEFVADRVRFTEELREAAKQYVSMTGIGWRAGEVGSLTTASYKATENLVLDGRLDVFKDRLYPSLEHPDRWNEDLDLEANWYPDMLTRTRLDYELQNARGSISELRTHSAGVSWNRSVPELKKTTLYASYRHQDNTYFTAQGLDYRNDRLYGGIRFNLIDELYYFFNQEFNWTTAKQSGEHARPHVYETGIDWYRQIWTSPFWGNVRLTYRDEEDAESAFSFLAGEDYLEAYAELTYRPSLDLEAYVSSRFRNVWAENPTTNKRMELSLYAGMRYLWDTGIRWEPIGMIEGFVFNDYNGDGIKQADEPSVEGITVWLGKHRQRTTNEAGYYLFPQVQARRATVYLDTASVPQHFVLTTPASQEVLVAQSGIAEVDFGITSRTEITGVIFEDIDQDNILSAKDKPLRGIAVELEDGSKAVTDSQGRYVFNKIAKGKHTIRLDLRTVPPDYIPTVSIFKDMELLEGASYTWHFPLKKVSP